MSLLDRFFNINTRSQGMTVIGTYLYPYRLLGEPDWNAPDSAIKVITQAKVKNHEVLITRNGGLFIIPPGNVTGVKEKIDFKYEAADIFNCIICEFALNGIVAEPATPVHISAGTLIDDHALIVSAGGGREIYLERTIEPSLHLIEQSSRWRMYPLCRLDKVEEAIKQKHASLLTKISGNLPTFIASAYSLFSQRQIGEAISDSWIAIEQILDYLWKEYISKITDTERKRGLEDKRTYTSAVRIELLYTAGRFSEPLYQALNKARDHRNRLTHRAEVNLTKATECMMAMIQIIEFYCGVSVEKPDTTEGVNW